MSFLQQTDPEINQIIEQEKIRQKNTINLIASENYASRAVLEAHGSFLTSKYQVPSSSMKIELSLPSPGRPGGQAIARGELHGPSGLSAVTKYMLDPRPKKSQYLFL